MGSVISSCYGFISGAYMPISSFGVGLQRAVMFLPGTYGTALIRNHALGGALQELVAIGIPEQSIQALRDTLDCNLYFFGESVSIGVMYAVLSLTTIALLGIYVLLNKLKKH